MTSVGYFSGRGVKTESVIYALLLFRAMLKLKWVGKEGPIWAKGLKKADNIGLKSIAGA